MGDKTGIEWTDATWNPFVGCAKVSAGCKFCYAERLVNGRLRGDFGTLDVKDDERWSLPIRWRRPRRIFVTSLSDPFWDKVPDRLIARMFAVMALAGQHTFQVLTKRADRMLRVVTALGRSIEPLEREARALGYSLKFDGRGLVPWPLPNVWLGVSTENQATFDDRVPMLLETPAAVRWISAEPLLGPIDCRPYLEAGAARLATGDPNHRLGWVVAGGESGPRARPMEWTWARSLRDQCQAAGVPFLFKQWGEHAPVTDWRVDSPTAGEIIGMAKVGKKAAGRMLDGRTWDEYPQGRSR